MGSRPFTNKGCERIVTPGNYFFNILHWVSLEKYSVQNTEI